MSTGEFEDMIRQLVMRSDQNPCGRWNYNYCIIENYDRVLSSTCSGSCNISSIEILLVDRAVLQKRKPCRIHFINDVQPGFGRHVFDVAVDSP